MRQQLSLLFSLLLFIFVLATSYTSVPALTSEGWFVQYYDNPNLEGPPIADWYDDYLDHEYGLEAPFESMDPDNFSIRWKAEYTATETGTYTFYTYSDDGVRLQVNDSLVINNWTDHGPTEDVGSINLVAGESYVFILEYYERYVGSVIKLEMSTPTTARAIIQPNLLTPAVPDYFQFPETSEENGIIGKYYNGINFDQFVAQRTDADINFFIGETSPLTGVNADNFSVRWEADLKAPVSGNYIFRTNSDDGVRLWIDDQLIIDNWTDHGPTFDTAAPIFFEAGSRHTFKLEYYDRYVNSSIRAYWSHPTSDGMKIIPRDNFFIPATNDSPTTSENPETPETQTGLTAEYYNGMTFETLKKSQIDPQVNFNWGRNTPIPGIGSDYFSVRWAGLVEAPITGPVTFSTYSDDGVRLWIDDQLIIDNWTDHGPIRDYATVEMIAGQEYPIQLEYYENQVGAVMQLDWEYQGQSRLSIPSLNLSPHTKPTEKPQPSVENSAETLRVLEVRYFPQPGTEIYHPDDLSPQLQELIENASRYHGYKDTNAQPQLDVEVVQVIDRVGARPNPDGTWRSVYNAILADGNLCEVIENEKIDQVWLWVDPRDGYDTAPGWESVVSSPYFQGSLPYGVTATPPFCSNRSFVFMGFDYSRTPELALHSIGHMMEATLSQLQTNDLFWNRFTGKSSSRYGEAHICGTVHFPPNGTSDYNYNNGASVSTSCEDWNPDNSGEQITLDCTRWGCTQGGYLTWWMQNMPALDTHTYQGKKIPSWFSFLTDLDQTIEKYRDDSDYFMNYDFVGQPQTNTIEPGLIAEFFNGISFDNFVVQRIDDQVDYDLGYDSPALEVQSDFFSARWTGFITAPLSGNITFSTYSDDGVRLWIDDQLIIDNWTDHGPTYNNGTISLVEGQKYNLKLEYYENQVGSVIQLGWKFPDGSFRVIPPEYLSQ